MKTSGFAKQANFKSLRAYYVANPIVLYAGAGISTTGEVPAGDGTKHRLGLPIWIPLLERLAAKLTGVSFVPSGGSAWEEADRILKGCVEALRRAGIEGDLEGMAESRLQEALWKLVRSDEHFTTHGKGRKRYKFLKRELLEAGMTLRSVIAFSARPIRCSASGEVYQFGVNPRIRAVLSGNYDPFLEAGATSMFKKRVLKPVAAIGSLAGDLREVPVYHIHGYVSHPGQREDADHHPAVERLVLSRSSYERAWQEHDAFSATMVPQIFLLRHYSALFIGFSFTDPMINRLLQRICDDNRRAHRDRWHYTILRKKRADRPRIRADLAKLGVRPVFIDEFSEVPEILKALYEAGFKMDYPSGKLLVPVTRDSKRRPAMRFRSVGFKVKELWNLVFTTYQGHPKKLSASPAELDAFFAALQHRSHP